MEDNLNDTQQINELNQVSTSSSNNDVEVNEWVNPEPPNKTTTNENDTICEGGTDQMESNNSVDSGNNQNNWMNHPTTTGPKNNYGNNRRGRGKFNKSNSRYSADRTWSGHDSSNDYQNNGGFVRGRGRGRGFGRTSNEENEGFSNGNKHYHNNDGNTGLGQRGRGRGHNRGRGRFREKTLDGWYENNESGHKKKEFNKSTGPKPEYIPPDIENEESIAGIEAGLNFDKYDTIEVKVSGGEAPKRITSFQSSGLHETLLNNLSTCNFTTPTPIQNYAVPIVIAGNDMMASAQTGSGKTVSIWFLS